MRLRKRGKGLVAVPDAELPALTAEQVRDTLERGAVVTAVDISLVVAAFASWHERHEAARRARSSASS